MRTALVVRSCRVLRGRRSPRLLSPDIMAAVNLAKESASNSRRRAVRDILMYGACGGVLTFELISGAVSAVTMLVGVPFADRIGWGKGEILGYTVPFGRGFAMGILITLISSA